MLSIVFLFTMGILLQKGCLIIKKKRYFDLHDYVTIIDVCLFPAETIF